MSESNLGEVVLSEQQLQEKSVKVVMDTFLAPNVKKPNPVMISVGCQFGYEANPFLEMFPEGTYHGIDIDGGIIRGAQRLHEGKDRITFTTLDARKEEELKKLNADIFFLRHPQTLGSFMGDVTMEDWRRIISNCAKATKSDGIVFATTHLPQEAILVQKYLEEVGLKVEVYANSNTVMLSIDSEIVIGKKLE